MDVPDNQENEIRLPPELKRHMNNLFEALLALCPSRNYLSQFLSFLPGEYPALYDSFPEFLADRELRNEMQSLLNLQYGPTIEIQPNSFGDKLGHLITTILDLLNDDQMLGAWANFLQNVRGNTPIANPLKEWNIMKLRAAVEDQTYGTIAREILNVVGNYSSAIQSSNPEDLFEDHSTEGGVSQEQLASKISSPPEKLPLALRFLTDHLRILQRCPPPATNPGGDSRYCLSKDINPEWLSGI